jgi:predicted RNase H-like HicB family nuclease
MSRDLAYYQSQPYARLWEAREEGGERYFVARIREFPRVAGDGATRAEALVHLREAFDDFVTWRLEDALEVPAPARGFIDPLLPRAAVEWSEVGGTATPMDHAERAVCSDLGEVGKEKPCPVSVAHSSRRLTEMVYADRLAAIAG